MHSVLKIALFLTVSAAGYLSILIVPYLAVYFHVYPAVPAEALPAFRSWYFMGSFLAFLGGILAGTGFFLTQGHKKILLLLAPLLTPLVWSVGVLTYFSRLGPPAP